MTDSVQKVLRFNDFELDIASREMRRNGQLVSLEPRVFSLLVYLHEHRHRAVDKDELQDEVWKGLIVTETALTRAIMKARRAANDSVRRPLAAAAVPCELRCVWQFQSQGSLPRLSGPDRPDPHRNHAGPCLDQHLPARRVLSQGHGRTRSQH